MEGSQGLIVKPLLLYESGDEPVGSPGGEGGTAGEAVAGTEADEHPHAECPQRGHGGLQAGAWVTGREEGKVGMSVQ